ncbi:hypothetical protein [Mesorhizobium sp. M0047]|uniref:hypothetical protein n=1 Tax=Mesorhizobium sp. M0047 TaxID=2956859 RepID=UPI00333C0424
MTHSTAVLFAQVRNRLLALTRDKPSLDQQPKSPAPVRWDAERDRLPPRDESFYWAWQYWSQ